MFFYLGSTTHTQNVPYDGMRILKLYLGIRVMGKLSSGISSTPKTDNTVKDLSIDMLFLADFWKKNASVLAIRYSTFYLYLFTMAIWLVISAAIFP